MLSLGISSPVNAYLTHNQNRSNEISVGKNETTITEDFPDITPIPYTDNPTIQKVVRVYSSNDPDNVDCYVRVRVLESNSAYGNAMEYCDLDTANWTYNAYDDFYYYHHILSPGEETTPLFTAIKVLGAEVDPEEAEKLQHVWIDVYEESIQAGEYTSYQDAWNAMSVSE
ncbi:MAG: hypothetical protein Q4B47_01340 [Eubacteriales bacterium]|nr:hypothetical protein [Eubacteriales bacterium]